MLEGRNPYPEGGFEPLVGNNHVWPPAAAALVAPLTVLSPAAADVTFMLFGIACMALALWLVGVRDWRVFGVAALWPPVLIEPRLGHLTPAVMLIAAIAWKGQRSRYLAGTSIGLGIAIKLFVWPLVVWLAAVGQRTGAAMAAAVGCASLLAVLPFTGFDAYVHALHRVSAAYDQDSYTVFGFIVQSGGSETVARVLTLALAVALLWGTWHYRSFTLAIGAALVASPIVWLDYFALSAIPLGIARPQLSPVWFVPLITVGAEGAGWKIGDVVDTARVLAAFGVVLTVAFRAEVARFDASDAGLSLATAPHSS
ncbi:MAG TPA: glycosyltransferase 87 family protein [Gaiella sp.]|nr:glycosyltransferase 87 family protein [Gaiella sp.]